MTSLWYKLAALALLVVAAACIPTEPLPPLARQPGLYGDAFAGSLDIEVIDEPTGAQMSANVEVVDATGRVFTGGGNGPYRFEDAALVPPLSVHVGGIARPQAFIGIASSRVVIGVARAGGLRVSGRVVGAETLGASAVVVGVVAPISFVRTDALGRGAPVPCVLDGDGCVFGIEDTAEGADTVVATLHDGAGAAIGFGITSLSSSGGVLVLPSVPIPTLSLVLPPTPTPPPGLSAVVGVPGLACASGVVFLAQAASADSRVVVPALSGLAGDPSWWIVAEARGVGEARSVILQRGLREPSAVGAWPAWLEVPSASIDADGRVTLLPSAGATLHAIDWLAASGAVVASALVVDAAAPIYFAPAVGATAIRVRAIDAVDASASALSLRAAEHTVTRFAESTIAIPPR